MSDVIDNRGHMLYFLNQDAHQSLKIVMFIANSVDPDEVLHSVASQLGLFLLPK